MKRNQTERGEKNNKNKNKRRKRKKNAMKFRRRQGVKEIEVIDRDGVSLTGIPLRLSKVGGWRENFISVGRFKTFSFIGSVDI